MNATETLAVLNDAGRSVADLAKMFGESEAWVAGMLDAATGDRDWALVWHEDDAQPTQAERDDYLAGFDAGLDLVAARATEEGWRECYGLAAVEEKNRAETLPVACGEFPW